MPFTLKSPTIRFLNTLGLCEDKVRTLRQGEFKHEVRQFEKSYDNQQAEQISLMV